MPILEIKHFLFLPHAAIFVEMAKSWKQGTWLSPERQQNFLESHHILAFSKYLRKLSSNARDFQGSSLEWWICCLVLFTFCVQFDFENGCEIHCQMLLQRTRLREKSNGRNWRDSKEQGLPLYHMQIKSWMMSNPSILLKSIYLAARDILQEPNDVESCPKVHDTLEVLMVKPVFNENSACKLKFFRWLLTRSYFTSTGTNVKIMLKFATILFSHFLLTKIILVQGVKLLILIKKIGWNVIFLSNIFTNAVLWFKIQQYLCNPLQFSCETSTLTKIFNLQFHIFFIIIYL